MIVKGGGKYTVKGESGRKMGSYSSMGEAMHRLRQIEFWKMKDEQPEKFAALKKKLGNK